jgi:hypothetical protein
MDQARELVHKMDGNAPATECERWYATYYAGWEQLHSASAPVIIAGPGELGKQTERLQSYLGALGDVCDGWYAAYMNGQTPSRLSKYGDARDAASQTRTVFIATAQKYVHPNLPGGA